MTSSFFPKSKLAFSMIIYPVFSGVGSSHTLTEAFNDHGHALTASDTHSF